MNGKYQFLLFDADETLFDFESSEKIAFFDLAQKMKVNVDDNVYSLYSSINTSLWKAHERGEISRENIQSLRYTKLLEAIGGDTSMGEKWNSEYENSLSQTVVLFEDSERVCRELAKNYRLFIITNGLAHVQSGRFSRINFADCFENIFISGNIGYSKPDVRFFDAVEASIEGFDKKRALVIGDSLTGDIEGARRAGIDSVLIDRRNLNPGGCEYIKARITDLDGLFDLL